MLKVSYISIKSLIGYVIFFQLTMDGIGAGDQELQQFVLMEQQKAQFQGQVHRVTDICWDKCVDRPRDKLDYKTESCMTNCVGRFVDVSLVITQRFQQTLQKSMGQ